MNNKTKKLTTFGMLCALAYVVAAVGRIPRSEERRVGKEC